MTARSASPRLQSVRALRWLVLLLPLSTFAGEPERVEIQRTESAHAPLMLIAPRDGTTLTAGTVARLAWRWRDVRPPEVEEWEAFLSLDGGATFAYRVTTHLQIERDEVSFDVPDLPSTDVRLLLRFGDEREETAVVFPDRFRIQASGVPQPRVTLTSSQRRGEAALPDDHGVAAWSEGPSDGSRRQRIEAVARPQIHGEIPLFQSAVGTLPFCPEPTFGSLAVPHVDPTRAFATATRSRLTADLPIARGSSAILSLVCRRNE